MVPSEDEVKAQDEEQTTTTTAAPNQAAEERLADARLTAVNNYAAEQAAQGNPPSQEVSEEEVA